MDKTMKHIIYVLWVLLLTSCSVDAQEIVEPERRDEVIVENNVFKVWYSEVKEQPTKLIYTSTNRPKNVDSHCQVIPSQIFLPNS